MFINWKRVKNWLKFHLGMECVARYGDKWVVTRKFIFIVRDCLELSKDKHKGGYWWTNDYSHNWSLFNTQEEALEKLQWHKDKLKEFNGHKLKP